MKCALVADQAMADLDKTGQHWLTKPLNDPQDWADNLGRQLRITDTHKTYIEEVLLSLVAQIEPMLQPWPQSSDLDEWKEMAQ